MWGRGPIGAVYKLRSGYLLPSSTDSKECGAGPADPAEKKKPQSLIGPVSSWQRAPRVTAALVGPCSRWSLPRCQRCVWVLTIYNYLNPYTSRQRIPYRMPLGLLTWPSRRVGPQLKPGGNPSSHGALARPGVVFTSSSLPLLSGSTTLTGPMCRLVLAGHQIFVAGHGGWE